MNELIISLQNKSALDIHSNYNVYHGGSQEWYENRWQQQAGCGPTTCANYMWYLAQTDKG